MGRRRFLWVSITLVILAGVFVLLLPMALAPIASQYLSDALGVPVRIGRISIAGTGPSISAYGITLRLAEDDAPVITLAGIHADLALGRLLQGQLALDSLAIEQPSITIRRTADGDINLAALLPPDVEDSPTTDAEGDAPDPGPIELDRLRLHDGTVEFLDETTTPPLSTIVHIDSASADDIHATLGGQARVALRSTSRIDDDTFNLELTYEAADDDSNLTAQLRTSGASLASVLVHARLDWHHVAGTLDAEVAYTRTVEGGVLGTHRVSVDLTGTDLALADSAAAEATFRAKNATLSDLVVDLAAQRVDLGTIDAEDFWALAYRDDAGLHVPFVPAPADEDAEESDWETVLGTVTLGKGALLLRDLPPGSPDLTVDVRSGKITTEDDAVRFVFDTAVGDGGIEFDGRAGPDDTTVKLAIEALGVPGLAAHLGMPIAFATGEVSGTLEGIFAEGAPRFSGHLTTTDVKSAPSEAHPEEVFAWATLELELTESTVAPPRIHVTSATMTWPYLMLHRRPDGVYPFTGMATAPEPTDAPEPGPEEPLRFVLDRTTIEHGRIEFYDTVFDDPYGAEMLEINGTIEDLRVSPVAVARFDLEGSIDELTPVTANGSIGDAALEAKIGIDRLRLAPLSRYIEPGISYDVTAGTATIDTAMKRRGAAITVDNDIDLARLKLRAHGIDPFKGELGVALPVALSLMKDSRGHIALDLPVTVDLDTQKYELGPSIVQAIRQALLGTLLSPVRILSSVLLGDDGEVFDLKPVPFAPGSIDLSDEGATRVAQLARLLERHAGLNLVLSPQTSSSDAAAGAEADGMAAADADPTALAATRAETIRRTLHESYGIDPKRVRARKPRVGSGKNTGPIVDVQLRSK